MYDLTLMVKQYAPESLEENQSRRKILSFLNDGNNQFCRSNLDGHMVGSGVLIHRPTQRILMNHHKILDKWLCFGGHADGEKNMIEVAQREVIEESGIHNIRQTSTNIFDIDVHNIPNNPKKKEPEHIHYDVCYLFETKDENFHISNESVDLKWCNLQDAYSLIAPAASHNTQINTRMYRLLDKCRRFL